MKTQEVLMMETASHGNRATMTGCQLVAFVCLTLVFEGCKRPAPAAPEKTLVRTTEVESMENARPDGEASYLAIIRAEKETDLSFKVAGILETIGPAPGTDWDEGTSVKAGGAGGVEAGGFHQFPELGVFFSKCPTGEGRVMSGGFHF